MITAIDAVGPKRIAKSVSSSASTSNAAASKWARRANANAEFPGPGMRHVPDQLAPGERLTLSEPGSISRLDSLRSLDVVNFDVAICSTRTASVSIRIDRVTTGRLSIASERPDELLRRCDTRRVAHQASRHVQQIARQSAHRNQRDRDENRG
jgi:hypothetical protein